MRTANAVFRLRPFVLLMTCMSFSFSVVFVPYFRQSPDTLMPDNTRYILRNIHPSLSRAARAGAL